VGCPCLPDQAAHGDDRVGEVGESVDAGGASLEAAGEPVAGVLQGVAAFDVPPVAGLDRRLLTFVRDAAMEAGDR
jgi:hypothetical protein